MLTSTQVELLLARAVELSSGQAPPGLLVPLPPLLSLAAFLLDALRGAYPPYSGNANKDKRFADGPLGYISDPLDLVALSDVSVLKNEFANVLKYVQRELTETIDAPAKALGVPDSSDAVVSLAEKLMRTLVEKGWHPSHLHAYFADESSKLELLAASDIADAIAKILARFPDGEYQKFTIYTPRLIGRGGEDW